MVGVSGFFFGGGPESMRAGALAAAAYFAAVVACLAAPVVGFSLNRRGKAAAGLAVAWLPPAVALMALRFRRLTRPSARSGKRRPCARPAPRPDRESESRPTSIGR